MIRVCKEADKEVLAEYLKDEPYGKAIAAALEAFGVDAPFETVYIDEEPGGESAEKKVRGAYLWLHGTLILYCKENQVGIDFLEEMMGIEAPRMVAGRKDNVNIVSWLLTDYDMETGKALPEFTDKEGNPVECLGRAEHEGDWAVLRR